MTKVTSLSDISGLPTYNENNDRIESAFENTVSRDGSSPNYMDASLDMNGHRLLNIPDAVSGQEPVTLSQATVIAGVENPLTQEIIGQYLYPETDAETNAGVTIVNPQYPSGNILRYYGGGGDYTIAIQAAIDQNAAGGMAVVIPGGTYSVGTTLTLASNVTIEGQGQTNTTISYTGSAQLFKSKIPGTRTYRVAMYDVLLQDAGTGTIGLDLDSVSEGFFENVTVDGFVTGIKIYSPTSGYAVYNRFEHVKAQNATKGIHITGTSSNANVFIACRGNVCTDAVVIEDSNDNTFMGCQFESGGDGVVITASVAGRSDSNHIANCRFENNSGDAINVGTDVRQTTIIGNYIVATGGAFTDSGTRTIYLGNGSGSTAYDSREFASALTDGSFRLERSAAAASSEPFVVIEDSNTGSGTPVTLKVITGRAAGSFLQAYRGGSKYFDVQANGQVVLQTHRTGTAAPTAAANYVGELFVDTSAKKLYVATATGSSPATDDWTILN